MAGGYADAPKDGIDQLLRKQAELERRIAELERPSGTQVAETVATMADLYALSVAVDAQQSQGTGFTMSTTMTTRATVSFTIPDGYTRALVFAGGFVYSGTAAGGGDRIYGGVQIASNSGPESIAFMTTTMLLAGVSAFHALTFSAAPGTPFTVNMRARLQNGPGDAAFAGASTATVAASVVYQR